MTRNVIHVHGFRDLSGQASWGFVQKKGNVSINRSGKMSAQNATEHDAAIAGILAALRLTSAELKSTHRPEDIQLMLATPEAVSAVQQAQRDGKIPHELSDIRKEIRAIRKLGATLKVSWSSLSEQTVQEELKSAA